MNKLKKAFEASSETTSASSPLLSSVSLLLADVSEDSWPSSAIWSPITLVMMKWNFRSLKETNFTAYLHFLICANNYPTTTTTTIIIIIINNNIPTTLHPNPKVADHFFSQKVLVSQSHSIAEAPALCLLWGTYPTFGKKEIHLSKVPLKWEMFVPLQNPYITKHFRYLKWRYSPI